jgi:hypothetical protein
MARRRRRVGGRQRLATVVGIALVLAIGGLLLGGIVSGANSSSAYVALVNSSFAAQTNTVTEAQTVQGQQLSILLASMTELDRQTLALRLSTLVSETERATQSQTRAAGPDPSGGIGPAMSSVVADRAAGVAAIAAGVEGLLGLEQPTTVGVAGSTSSGASLLPSSVVTARLIAAGETIARADDRVGPLRVSLAAAPGHAHLIRDVFVPRVSLLSSSAMTELVAALQSSTSLAIDHDVQLVTVGIAPSPLPSPAAFNLVQLPPTKRISIAVTLRNLGNVLERDVKVSVSLTSSQGATLASTVASGPILAAGALTLRIPPMKVVPGADVILTITVTPPAGQVDHSALGEQLGIAVAP